MYRDRWQHESRAKARDVKRTKLNIMPKEGPAPLDTDIPQPNLDVAEVEVATEVVSKSPPPISSDLMEVTLTQEEMDLANLLETAGKLEFI